MRSLPRCHPFEIATPTALTRLVSTPGRPNRRTRAVYSVRPHDRGVNLSPHFGRGTNSPACFTVHREARGIDVREFEGGYNVYSPGAKNVSPRTYSGFHSQLIVSHNDSNEDGNDGLEGEPL